MVYSRLHTKTLAFTTIQALRGQREQGYIFSYCNLNTLELLHSSADEKQTRPNHLSKLCNPAFWHVGWAQLHDGMMAFYKQMSCSVQCLLETKKVGKDKVVAAP